jgi:hypothetical protein
MTGLKGAMPVSAERRYENNVNEVQLMTQFFENDERITHHAMRILRGDDGLYLQEPFRGCP